MTRRLAAATTMTLLPVCVGCGGGGTHPVVDSAPCLADQVTAGVSATWVLKPDKTAWYWGYGRPTDLPPAQLAAAPWTWFPPDTTALFMRSDNVCILSTGGDLRCETGPAYPSCSYSTSGPYVCTSGAPNVQTTPLAGVARVKAGLSINGNLSDPVAAPNGSFTLAVKNDGTLWGVGYTDDPSSVKEQTDLGTDVLTASAGWLQRCAVKTGGAVWCWGRGFLGDGMDEHPSGGPEQPPAPVSLPSAAVDVVASFDSTEVVLDDGTVRHWGSVGFGDSSRADRLPALTPVPIDGISDVKTLTGGAFHYCALKNDGSVWCWGSDYYGEAGYEPGGVADSATWEMPRQVTALGNDVTQIAAGDTHTCARKADATIWCWGHGTWGQLGGNVAVNPTPVQMMGCQ